MLRHISLGPAVIQTSLVVYLIAFYASIEITRRYAPKRDIDGNVAQNAVMLDGIMGLLGARITYGFQHWSVYKNNLGDWFSITPQGLNVIGGIAVSILVAFAYAKRQGIATRAFADALAPSLGFIMLIIPLGFLANGSVIGKPSDLPWAIDLQLDMRHPTQIYGMIGSALTLAIWWKWVRHYSIEGGSFLFVLFGNALVWLLNGLLLAEPALIIHYRLIQVIGWAILIVAAFTWSIWTDTEQVADSSSA